VFTPDQLMRGVLPEGDEVVLYDDDHYYLGGVLAELLVAAGKQVTLVTPEARVSAWTENTLEQPRIHRRLVDAGVKIVLSNALIASGRDGVHFACTYTHRETLLSPDALVLLTARLPEDALVAEIEALDDGPTVRAIGDAFAPGTIAAAVWDGHRYAQELDDPAAADPDRIPFRREIIALPTE
jgi:dimethylamine/trimethylamine dehydrogenase